MPNDARLGLAVGLGLVIAIAVLFFRKDAPVDPHPPAAAARAQADDAASSHPPVEAQPTQFRPAGQD